MREMIVLVTRLSTQTMVVLLTLVLGDEALATQSCPVPQAAGLPWSSPSTWGGAVPGTGAAVVIPAGKRIVLDIDPPPLKSITIEGQLAFDTTKDLNLSADAIIAVGQGAKFEIGTPSNPYLKRATITLTGSNPNENVMGMGTKVLGAQMGAVIEITGESRVMWTQLGATAAKGASSITLKEPVDWRIGDRIVIASSAMKADEAEERFITSVNGSTVTLNTAAPTTPFRVLRCLRNEQCEQNDALWPVINPAASPQALQAQAGPGYVVDAASQRIYFKLTAEDRLRFTRQ